VSTPQQHYETAEKLLAEVNAWYERDYDKTPIRQLLAQAQIHATLATCDPGLVNGKL